MDNPKVKYLKNLERVTNELEMQGVTGIEKEYRNRGHSFDICVVRDGKIHTVFELVMDTSFRLRMPLVISRCRNNISTIPFVQNFIIVCVENNKVKYYDFSNEVIWNQEWSDETIENNIQANSLNVSDLKALIPEIFEKKKEDRWDFRKLAYCLIPYIIIAIGILDRIGWYILNMERLILLSMFLIFILIPKIEEIRIGDIELKMREQRAKDNNRQGLR